MHIVPVPIVRAACHVIANVDQASAVALRINEIVVATTIDTVPCISKVSVFLIHEFDKIGTLAIALVMWMVENAV